MIIIINKNGGLVAQLVERCPCKAEAAGSNPAESSFLNSTCT